MVQGHTYNPFDIQAEGFETSSQGTAARPKLRVSNVFGLIGVLLTQFGGLEGAIVTRKVTLARFLDAVSFPGGVNPEANPSEHYPDDVWTVARCGPGQGGRRGGPEAPPAGASGRDRGDATSTEALAALVASWAG